MESLTWLKQLYISIKVYYTQYIMGSSLEANTNVGTKQYVNPTEDFKNLIKLTIDIYFCFLSDDRP